MAAVASLTAMLESTKPYLAAAEEITPHQAAFTPFSAILGSMIREMHRCLVQALVAENYKAVLTQIIKVTVTLDVGKTDGFILFHVFVDSYINSFFVIMYRK